MNCLLCRSSIPNLGEPEPNKIVIFPTGREENLPDVLRFLYSTPIKNNRGYGRKDINAISANGTSRLVGKKQEIHDQGTKSNIVDRYSKIKEFSL